LDLGLGKKFGKSYENLKKGDGLRERTQHLQKVKNIHEQVFYFHAHTYYDHNSAEKRQLCWDFCEKLKDAFEGNPHVEVHTFQETAVSRSLLLPT